MSSEGKVCMISGRTGSGKTTIAKLLARELPAFRISHDELLLDLYGNTIEDEQFDVCCERINRMVWKQVEQLTRLGTTLIIEGWGSRRLRDQAREETHKMGVACGFIYVDCPAEIRLERVRKRNEFLKNDIPHISDDDFYRMEKIKEEFESDEKHTKLDNRGRIMTGKELLECLKAAEESERKI